MKKTLIVLALVVTHWSTYTWGHVVGWDRGRDSRNRSTRSGGRR